MFFRLRSVEMSPCRKTRALQCFEGFSECSPCCEDGGQGPGTRAYQCPRLSGVSASREFGSHRTVLIIERQELCILLAQEKTLRFSPKSQQEERLSLPDKEKSDRKAEGGL